jgi:hypothetical protein
MLGNSGPWRIHEKTETGGGHLLHWWIPAGKHSSLQQRRSIDLFFLFLFSKFFYW